MGTTGRCDREALAALAAGELDAGRRVTVLEHLRGCPTCREELRALGQVDRLLGGGTPPAHPSAAALTDYAAGGLEADARAQLAAHLAQCAACAALERAA